LTKISGFPKENRKELDEREKQAPKERKAIWKMFRVTYRDIEKSEEVELVCIMHVARLILDFERAGYPDDANGMKNTFVRVCVTKI
jgi:hypothetical protein